MATDSRPKALAYHHKLFLLLMIFSGALVTCSLVFQHRRETHFKEEQLNARLQLFNMKLTDALEDSIAPDEFLRRTALPLPDLRISIIDRHGRVAFDNTLDTLPTANHLSRKEIAGAMRHGTAYTVRRHSQYKDENYFYSAMADSSGTIVRSAVPYSSLSLADLLAADRDFIWFMTAAALLLGVLAYFATRRLGHNISRLNSFAERAERGERIYADDAFPDDELGEISNHIVRLYARLQNAVAERDRQHRLALHEEQEKIRIKKQLTNNINHELKTPVAAMQACLETLMTHPDLTEERRAKFIRMCHANCERLGSLLNDVATITRMDDGSRLIARAPMDLTAIVRAAIDDTPESGMTLLSDLPDGLTVCGNADLMTSVFRNLIDNAVAYSGGTRLEISLVSDSQDMLTLRVADNGTGVEPQHLPHLFERFYRVDKGRSRKLGGTGLGLSIVRNAVVFHGGTISVANRDGGGLEFVMTVRKG